MESQSQQIPRYPFYLEYSVDVHKKYNFHLSFESAAVAQSASEFMRNELQLPITITGNCVIIRAKPEGVEFGVDKHLYIGYNRFGYRLISNESIGVRSVNNVLSHLFFTSNSNPKFIFSSCGDWIYCSLPHFKRHIPSWHRRQMLLRQPHYDTSIFKKFRLFRLLSEVTNFSKDLFWPIFQYLLVWGKNPLYVPSIEPYINKFLLNQTPYFNSYDTPEEEKSLLFQVTYCLELENSQDAGSSLGGAELHLLPAQGEGRKLADFLQKNLSIEIHDKEYTRITISPSLIAGFSHGVTIPSLVYYKSPDNIICDIHFKTEKQAYEFTQRVCLKNDKGEMLAYRLKKDRLILLPRATLNPDIMYGDQNSLYQKHLSKNKAKISLKPAKHSLKGTALKTAIDELNKIVLENPHDEKELIYSATSQLKKTLTQTTDRETRLAAIRDYERACGIDLGTKIGQAVAMVIVAAIAFTLGVVIGEALGIASGVWSDLTSATLKIIETFSGSITASALAVLGGATLGGVAASTITYCAFFKPSAEKVAAEEVASEAKVFAKHYL